MRTDNVVLSAGAGRRVQRCSAVTAQSSVAGAAPVQHQGEERAGGARSHPSQHTAAYPESLAGELNGQELSLYRLIWQRTLPPRWPMPPAPRCRCAEATAIENAASSDCEFAASGTTITFAGYRQVYVESTDDTEANDEEKEARCRRSPSANRCR